MVTIQQGLTEEGVVVSMSQLCRWLDVPRQRQHSCRAQPARAALW